MNDPRPHIVIIGGGFGGLLLRCLPRSLSHQLGAETFDGKGSPEMNP